MFPITTISYLAAALAFLTLAVLTLARWRDRPASLWIVLASVFTVAWAVNLAALSWIHQAVTISGGALEVARSAGWFAVLLALLAADERRGALKGSLRWWIGLTAAFLLVVLAMMIGPGWLHYGPAHSIAMLLMAIVGLVLVEQVFRNTPLQGRWSIKPLSLGLGAMFAFDLFLFADLVLFGALESPTWQARGLIAVIVVPLIAVSVGRSQRHRDTPTVSRNLLFHTAALVGSGLYLLAVGAAGYYLRHAGGDVGALLQVLFFFGAGLLLLLMLFSGTFQARLRVYLAKHLFKYRYDYRREWLRFAETLSSTESEMPFSQRAIQSIGELVESPGGLLWVRGDDGSYVLDGILNMGEPTHLPIPDDSPLVDFLNRTGWVIDFEEYRSAPDRYNNIPLPEWMTDDPRCWILSPLFSGEVLQGFVVLAQPRVRHPIGWEERDLLKTAGRQLAVYVALVKTSAALLEANQFEAFHRLAAFLIHDLKNVSAQLSLVCANAERHRDNPAFIDDAFGTIANARDRLERTLAQLRKTEARPFAQPQTVSLAAILNSVARECRTMLPVPQSEIRENSEVLADRDTLRNVLLHMIRNAQEATAADGRITLRIDTDGRWSVIEIEDNGTGIDPAFLRQRLFRPFQTTKGNAGMGIGLYEARAQVQQMGGHIEVDSKIGSGTRFTIRLPRNERSATSGAVTAEPQAANNG